jgi:hypothetical protein
VAFAVRIPNLQSQAAVLAENAIPYQSIGSRLIVPASAAHGVTIAFEPE